MGLIPFWGKRGRNPYLVVFRGLLLTGLRDHFWWGSEDTMI